MGAGDEPLASGSKFRRYWDKEDKKRAKAMREAGICLVSWDQGDR
jgi:hypothetical protein